jgi:hypothetical protein
MPRANADTRMQPGTWRVTQHLTFNGVPGKPMPVRTSVLYAWPVEHVTTAEVIFKYILRDDADVEASKVWAKNGELGGNYQQGRNEDIRAQNIPYHGSYDPRSVHLEKDYQFLSYKVHETDDATLVAGP